jgi:hypothetical protein
MKVFPQTAYCMNLDSRKDRWELVTEDFKKLQKLMDIKLERISAVPIPDKPQLGVAQTVHKIINIAKEKNLDNILILEDDLYIIEAQKIVDCLSDAPKDWDILSGGVYHYIPDNSVNENWMKMRDFCSLHFIIIRNTIYDSVLKCDGSNHIDRALGALVRSGKIKMYLMHPMPCQQRPGFSNIRKRNVDDNKRNLPWLDTDNTLKNTVIRNEQNFKFERPLIIQNRRIECDTQKFKNRSIQTLFPNIIQADSTSTQKPIPPPLEASLSLTVRDIPFPLEAKSIRKPRPNKELPELQIKESLLSEYNDEIPEFKKPPKPQKPDHPKNK